LTDSKLILFLVLFGQTRRGRYTPPVYTLQRKNEVGYILVCPLLGRINPEVRRGEIRGLQCGDIADGLITVRHNYQDMEGLILP